MGWILFIVMVSVLAYHHASLKVWTLATAVFLGLFSALSTTSYFNLGLDWLFFLMIALVLNVSSLRRKIITQPALTIYRKIMPTMSRTEREALTAGTVGWEGDLFRGNPDWEKLLAIPKPQLSSEEQAFIDGSVEKLCSMIHDWNITHHLADLPQEIWNFLKEQGFFGLIIPKKFGGKEFSAYAHSQILVKVYGCSASVATTIAVPNSLGPAELLLHYGTQEQQDYYLPRLARGEEIPCFALTGPEAGSDASAMTDTGIVCWGDYQGKKIIGIRLNWNKRYITLAPIATVIGLAFKLYDPDHLIGKKENIGITCVLVPRDTPGVVVGRRHLPANAVFQNGPTQGHDVFIPLDFIIGGASMAGNGWRMLMECLAAGRGITLPASSMGGSKILSYTTGAYARVRHQFNVPIGQFEGIEEALARIAGRSYIMDATRSFTTSLIDQGEKPAVASAITKYHVTELGRLVVNDAMDIHGGKAVCLGPKNYISSFYQSLPIAITVEGANILTRSLIIFGQGAMRCHPFVFAEFEAALQTDPEQRLITFDKALISHMSFTFSNLIRTLLLGLTGAKIVKAPAGKTKHYFQTLTRFSSAFALFADMSLFVLGGNLKRKESLSARLGDILSYLYMISAIVKHYHDQGKNEEDLPLVQWSCQTLFYQVQQRFNELLKNFPNRFLSFVLRLIIFPLGQHFSKPNDKLGRQVAKLLLSPTSSRQRLANGAYLARHSSGGLLEDALMKSIAAEPIEKIIKSALKEKRIAGITRIDQAEAAFTKKIISKEQLTILLEAEKAKSEVIAVDDFAADALKRTAGKKAHAEKTNL